MRDGQPVISFEYNKVRALLAYLVVESERPHRREALAGLLWPDQPQKAALNGLRNALAKLRQAIDDKNADPPYLFISNETIQFNTSSEFWLDEDRFIHLLATTKTHRHRRLECCQSCSERLTQATELYNGEFLQGFDLADSDLFNDWISLKREKLSRLALEAFIKLASIYERQGDYAQALVYTWRQLELDPCMEEAHTQAMELLAASGQRSEACAQYEKCRMLLMDELGIEPTEKTTRLYEEIKYGLFQATPTLEKLRINNLPSSLTSFVGRERELNEINLLLENPDCHLLTLVGPGGVGKTRLALAVAWQQFKAFPHGACFVPLAEISSVEFIVPAILQAFNLKQSEQGNITEQLIGYLQDKELILVLDNFEHLVEGAGLISDILQRAPGVMAVVTSRERLDLQAEWLFEVNGLSYPAGKATQNLAAYDAVQLFTQRLHQIKPHLSLFQDDLLSVSRICQQVEGLPLGIELAASAIKQRSIEQVVTAIESGKEDLASAWRDVPERHRSLRAVFENSWRLLTEQEKSVFRGLAVFRGGFTAEAARQVTDATQSVLDSLVEHFLLRFNPQLARFNMHEMLRQYALEKLIVEDMEPTLRQRHLNYYIDLAENSYIVYHEKLLWTELARLAPEMDNCRAALGWCFSSNLMEPALQLVGALGDFWLHFGYGLEADAWLMKILDSGYLFKRNHYLARTLLLAGFIIKNRDMEAGKAFLEQSLSIWKEHGDEEHVAVALLNLYYFPLMQGEYEIAIGMLEQALNIFERLGNQIQTAATMNDLGDVYLVYDEQNYLDKARSLGEQALAIDRRIGRTNAIHWDLKLLGHIEMRQGNFSQARAWFEEAVAQVKDLDNEIELSEVFHALGTACYYLGDYSSARTYFERRLTTTITSHFGFRDLSTLCELSYLVCRQGELDQALFHFKEVFRQLDTGGDTCIAIINGFLERIPWVLQAWGEPERAATLYGFTDALREKQKASLPNYMRPDYERDLAETRRQLGEVKFNAAWKDGRSMTLEQAKACALQPMVRITATPAVKPSA